MKTIKLDYITKIYGHASLSVKISNSAVEKAEMDVFESSRFFESLVLNKRYDEVSSITSRICGICSASHNITSIMAIENAFGVKPGEQTRKLRELLIYGEFIQSHALHFYFLALPERLGYSGIIEMAKERKDIVERAFRLKRLGNIMSLGVGGRSIHPLTTCVGGFNQIPSMEKLEGILKLLKSARKDARETIRLVRHFDSGFSRERALVSLDSYDMLNGNMIVGRRPVKKGDYRGCLTIEKRPYSTSKFAMLGSKEITVGPLARIAHNKRLISKSARNAAKKISADNPFDANAARAVEIAHCIDKGIEIIEKNKFTGEKNNFDFSRLKKKIYEGFAITEAPRGALYHSYRINRHGFVSGSEIITPTAQNLGAIEGDVRAFLPPLLKKPKERIVLELESLIRSYDPCISCSTHFLELNMTRRALSKATKKS